MAKKVWISLPLITASETNDAAVVSFLKGGLKKELEVEAAAFITKWMFDKDVPFGIDFDSAAVDRNLVVAALPKRVQKALGVTAPVVTEAGEPAQPAEAVDQQLGVFAAEEIPADPEAEAEPETGVAEPATDPITGAVTAEPSAER